MPISVQCSECNKKLNAPDSAVGKRVRCPACKSLIDVLDPDEGLVEADDEVAVMPELRPARRKGKESDDGERTRKKRARDEDNYETTDEDDEDEEDEFDRRRRKKKKRSQGRETHRGIIILMVGIASIFFAWIPVVCWVLAAFAERMANTDLAKMDSGKMDRSGHTMTQYGRICAYIGAILGLIGCFTLGYFRSR